MSLEMFLLVVLIRSFDAVQAESHPDEIQQLPGWNQSINFRQYSGFLKVSSDKFLHYWFIESQNSPANDPLMLWLNGGPGCSSVAGFLTEIGPFKVDSGGNRLLYNNYTWNSVANVIFLESPVGVGFSYSVSDNHETDDDQVAQDNYVALQKFFEKFPEFARNEFYVTGESYAGVYIPTLCVKILDGDHAINLKGFAIGNGYLDEGMLSSSLMFWAYHHGLVGDEFWNNLSIHCCKGGLPSQTACDFEKRMTNLCRQLVAYANTTTIHDHNLNAYNIYAKCLHPEKNSTYLNSRYHIDKLNLLKLFSTQEDVSKLLKGNPPCIDTADMNRYLNQKSVRQALHIPEDIRPWYLCNPELHSNYGKSYPTVMPIVHRLVTTWRLRALIYNGDLDMVCNFLSNEWFTSSLNLTLVKAYTSWEYENQIAGYVTYYDHLTYMIVKGAGHMVPEDKPGPSLEMITKFLQNKMLVLSDLDK